jgi:hypothetical protein
MADSSEGNLRINGREYDPSDMTFREQRAMRAIIRDELYPEDPDVDMDELTLADLLPAMVVVLVRRDDPDYTLDQALDLKHKDVYVVAEDEPATTPPTSAGSRKKSTRAASGIPS